MHIQRVRFDRVFSVHRKHTNWGKWTEFGFEFDSTKVLQASVYGHPEIPTNTELNLATPRSADWKNICGWSIASSGEVVVDEQQSHLAPLVLLWVAFLAAFGPIYVLNAQGFDAGQKIGFLMGLVGVSAIMGFAVRRALRIQSASRLLSAA